MFRNIADCVVLYPADAYATERCVELAAGVRGIVYIRTNRGATPIIYDASETFEIGGLKVLKKSGADRVCVIGAGMTLFEALAAYDALKKEGVPIRVIDLYCVKPIDAGRLAEALSGVGAVLTVEDHHPEGGIGEAVRSALDDAVTAASALPVHSLAVRKIPRSGRPAELLDYEEISRDAIVKKVKELL